MSAQFCRRHRRSWAFTLAELTVVIALFGIFSTTALSALNITLKYWSRVSNQVEMNAMCRMVISTISKELRQAMPDKSPGHEVYFIEQDGTTTTELATVHTPNQVGQVSNSITFAEANPNNFEPVNSDWDEQDPSKYRLVSYKIDANNQLVREVTSYSTSTTPVASAITAAADNVEFTVTCKSSTMYELKVTCKRFVGSTTYEATLSTDVIILGK